MRIDLHCHTIKTKSGDSPKRNVTKEEFVRKLSDMDVVLCAITNHNRFDYKQYLEFSSADHTIVIFPGIELDVQGHESKGHCIIVSDPDDSDKFNNLMNQLIGNNSPDDFVIQIDELIKHIKDSNYIVIPHYGSKTESLKDTDITYLKQNIGITPFLLEPSNLRSAGIMIAHNISTIIGSDVKDWSKYHECNLPELKIRIDGYQHFLKLLRKDIPTINTFVLGKFCENVRIKPADYPDCDITLAIYNDINVIFGGKGTGKTEILLKNIEKHFVNKNNNDVSTYYPSDNLNEFDKFKSITLSETDLLKVTNNDLERHFETLSRHKTPSLTPTADYYKWKYFSTARRFPFGYEAAVFAESKITIMNKYNNELEHYSKIKSAISNLKLLAAPPYLTENDQHTLGEILTRLASKSWEVVLESFAAYKALELLDWSLSKLKSIYKSKTGNEPKPSKTGLVTLYDSCLSVFEAAKEIRNALNAHSVKDSKVIGSLMDKGRIYREFSYSINPKFATTGTKYLRNGLNKFKLTKFKDIIDKLFEVAFSEEVNGIIVEYKNEQQALSINSLKDLLLCNSRFVDENGDTYEPSPGEKAMLILHEKLNDESKNVFILDEPESKVGHKYINDVIIPRLLYLARLDKKIIITTHDANIAIRTLPLTSIFRLQYRVDEGVKYKTYIGSPFISQMVNFEDENDKIDWVKVSMDTLEGGRKAFIERGENYGD